MQSVQIGLVFARSGQRLTVYVPSHLAQTLTAQSAEKALASLATYAVKATPAFTNATRPQ